MVATEIRKNRYDLLTNEQRIKLALFDDFGDDAKKVYDWLQYNRTKPVFQAQANADGVYYIYTDGSVELFDYATQNKPTKQVMRIGVVMGSHSLAVNLNDYKAQPLTCNEDNTGYNQYCPKRFLKNKKGSCKLRKKIRPMGQFA